jgi:hypothetical protein
MAGCFSWNVTPTGSGIWSREESGMSKRGRTIRRGFTAEQKATMLRRHFVGKVAVSDLCDEYKIQPSLFYLWQRQALGNLEPPSRGRCRSSWT